MLVRCMRTAIVALFVTVAARADALAMPDPVDDAVFRESLRERGLDPWLEQYFADSSAPDAVDAQLRQREQLLADASRADVPSAERESRIRQARDILARLLAAHPDHPSRFRWYVELARDDLERLRPAVFRDLVLYDLPGRDRRMAHELSQQAAESLRALRGEIDAAWSYVESLDEPGIDRMIASGSLAILETIDAQSAMLAAWARLYEALSTEVPTTAPAEAFSEVLSDATERHGWVDLPSGREAEQCAALLMAAMAARRLDRPAEAEAYAVRARKVASTVADSTVGRRLELTALLARFEQIRAKRDAGQFDVALQEVEQLRPELSGRAARDPAPLLGLALLESTIEALRQSSAGAAATQPSATGLLLGRFALTPLQRFAETGPSNRDSLYTILAPAVATEPLAAPRTLFERQLLIGAAVADALTPGSMAEPAIRARLGEAVAAAREMLNLLPAARSESIRGETLFLLGRAHYQVGSPLEAVGDLCDLVERIPAHDRVPTAVRQAAAVAREELRRAGDPAPAAVRTAFIRAGRLLRAKLPDDLDGRVLHFFIAAALEAEGRMAEAAAAYALVPPGQGQDLAAALGGVRCWRNMLEPVASRPTGDSTHLRSQVEEACKAADAAANLLRSSTATTRGADESEERCLAASLTVLVADLLNQPVVAKPENAITLLQDFESRYAECPDLIGPALRQRIIALRQLKRLSDAGTVIDAFLAADPGGAGPVMAGLLEAMRNEIEAAANRGDDRAVSEGANEALRLGETLLDWSKHNAGRISAEDLLTIRLWFAWCLHYAGRADQALSTFEACERVAEGVLPSDSLRRHEIRLGRAEVLVALSRPTDALPLFDEAWKRLPEHSPGWWQAYVGSLTCHAQLGHDPERIRQSIRQQAFLSPDLGGPRWRRALEKLESAVTSRPAATGQP